MLKVGIDYENMSHDDKINTQFCFAIFSLNKHCIWYLHFEDMYATHGSRNSKNKEKKLSPRLLHR